MIFSATAAVTITVIHCCFGHGWCFVSIVRFIYVFVSVIYYLRSNEFSAQIGAKRNANGHFARFRYDSTIFAGTKNKQEKQNLCLAHSKQRMEHEMVNACV